MSKCKTWQFDREICPFFPEIGIYAIRRLIEKNSNLLILAKICKLTIKNSNLPFLTINMAVFYLGT